MKRLLLVIAFTWAAAVQAQTMVYETHDGRPVFKIKYPAGWVVDLDFDKPRKDHPGPPPPRIVEAMPNDGSLVWLGIWMPRRVTSFDEAEDYLDSLEQHILSDVKANPPRAQYLNGMPARIIDGTAKKDNDEVVWAMAFFQPADGVIGAALYVAVPAAVKKHQKDLDELIASLRPLN